MPTATLQATESLSPWWNRAVALVMVVGFSALILMSLKAYQNAPPIPATSAAPGGEVIYTAADVSSGQAVFLKYGLMNNGTIWGHGGMLGPDFSAQTLHNLALFYAERLVEQRSSQDEMGSGISMPYASPTVISRPKSGRSSTIFWSAPGQSLTGTRMSRYGRQHRR